MLLTNLMHHRTRHSQRSANRPHRRSFVPKLDILEDRTVPTTLGPLINLSDPDVLAACGSNGAEKESYIVVNPANPKNIVATWFGGGALGTVAAVTVNGGKNWQQVIIPGLTLCTGGSPEFERVADPWLAFAPNGDLYHFSIPFNFDSPATGVFVSKSVDGGLHWTSPSLLDETTDKHVRFDVPAAIADPRDSRFVYAVWYQGFFGGNEGFGGSSGVVRFARTTDGGATWEPARTIYDPGSNNKAWGARLVVLPDDTLAAIFVNLPYSNNKGSGQKGAVLSVMRSTDRGETWSAPIQGPTVPSFQLTDPENSFPIVNAASYPALLAPAVDPNSGNIYMVFEDNRFSGGQYSSIAFTMSADGGLTWSNPIPVNQTPTNIPSANRNAFLPSVAVADDGTIGVTYYDFRNNNPSPGLPTDYWLVRYHPSATASPTDPASWGGEVRLTNSSFNLEGAPTGLTEAYFIGDYEGLTTSGNDFLAAWSQPHGTDPDSVFFRRAYGDSPFSIGSSIAAAKFGTPATRRFRDTTITDNQVAGGAGLAVDTYFIDLARGNQTTRSVPIGDTAPWRRFGPAPPSLPGGTHQVVLPPARVSGTLSSALARRAAHRLAHDWVTDVLISADSWWDGQDAACAAR